MELLTKGQSDKLECIEQFFRRERTLILKYSGGGGQRAGEEAENKCWRESMERMVLRRTEGYLEEQARSHFINEAQYNQDKKDCWNGKFRLNSLNR